MSSIKTIKIKKLNNSLSNDVDDSIVVEKLLNIFINENYYASLMCTPDNIKDLAIGFLFSEGVINSTDSIKDLVIRDENTLCLTINLNLIFDFNLDNKNENYSLFKMKAITSGCASGSVLLTSLDSSVLKVINSERKFRSSNILALMKEFNSKSELFKLTGGVHSASICDENNILIFSEDIGRHNAVDKVIGRALIDKLELSNKLVMTTGRLSSEIIIKTAKAGIPIIVSHSAPTDLALNMASAANMTLIGFVRGSRMNIYCGDGRITL